MLLLFLVLFDCDVHWTMHKQFIIHTFIYYYDLRTWPQFLFCCWLKSLKNTHKTYGCCLLLLILLMFFLYFLLLFLLFIIIPLAEWRKASCNNKQLQYTQSSSSSISQAKTIHYKQQQIIIMIIMVRSGWGSFNISRQHQRNDRSLWRDQWNLENKEIGIVSPKDMGEIYQTFVLRS